MTRKFLDPVSIFQIEVGLHALFPISWQGHTKLVSGQKLCKAQYPVHICLIIVADFSDTCSMFSTSS